MASITPAQLKKIWATARELDLDSELLHSFVQRLTGSDSIKALTKAQANVVIDNLGQKTVKRGRSKNGKPLATKKQLWYIKDLSKQLGWDDNPKRLQGFIKKYAKVDHIRWLTVDQAGRIIEGLKSMAEREEENDDRVPQHNS